MKHIEEHIKNSQDWQLEKAREELKAVSANTKNTVLKNISDSYVNKISLELHIRKITFKNLKNE